MRLWVLRVCCGVLAAVLFVTHAVAQDAGQASSSRPREVQKLIDYAKDPERLRQAMTDPQQVQELLGLMESETVREYFRDPERMRELMSEINIVQLGQVMQGVDMSLIRRAAAARWLDRLKKQLGATDDEWKVLGPKIEQIVQLREEARAGVRGFNAGGFGGGGPRGFGGGLGGPSSAEGAEVAEAAAALRDGLRDPDVPDRDRRLLLEDYRRAREKSRKCVTQAESELRDLLTPRQEAILVNLGLSE